MPNNNSPSLPTAKPPRLLDQLRAKTRLLHYSIRTEDAYVNWVRRFILFHGKRHPLDMWDDVVKHAAENKFPGGTDLLAFKYHGLFFVGLVLMAVTCGLVALAFV